MSSQPSTVDVARDAAANVIGNAAAAVSTESTKSSKPQITKDLQGQVCEKGSFKDQLSQASQGHPEPKETTYLEKALSYIPGVEPARAESQEQEPPNESRPPVRPDHDIQVEEFIRDQYRTDGKKPTKMREDSESDPVNAA
ncbi:hypothetical protein PVAG01_05726 [Phlyctema vagabunda]|uniref:Uncharacterized protein n=1 Tax=Phlyctema vagabunda TaxID=108571 RepID=A0ABR4PL01_9HELO